MTEWKEYKLRDLFKGTKSGDWGKDSPEGNYVEEVTCLRGADIPATNLQEINKAPTRYISEKNFSERRLSVGDLMIEMSGGSPTQSTGRIAYISQNVLDIYNSRLICSNFCKVLQVNSNLIDSSFTYYLWVYLYNKRLFFSYENGTNGLKNLFLDAVLDYESVNIPKDLYEQKKIALQLSEIDDKIAVNRKICRNLEAQAQILFKHWFVDFAPFKDGKFVESELGLIPEGLVYKRIEDIPHTLETGKRPSGGVKGIDRGIPSIGAENIKGLGCYDFSKTKYITEEYASTMKKGIINGYELLIYKDGGKPGYFIPNFAIFGEGYPYDKMCLNEHVFKLDFGNKGYSLFAYFYFKTKQIMSYLNAQGAKAAIPGINSKDIDAIMMPSLDNECVKQYCSEVEDFITQILVLGKESSRLASLRDTLLPKLMSGQIKL